MGIFSNDSSNSDYSEQRVTELVEAAAGNVKEKHLTKDSGMIFTYLYDGPLIKHIGDDEQPHYLFSNNSKGYRITEQDGYEDTPHHTGSEGKRYLVITDEQIVYVAGCRDGDETIRCTYNEISDVERSGNSNIQYQITNGKTYKFAPQASKVQLVDEAIRYISEQIAQNQEQRTEYTTKPKTENNTTNNTQQKSADNTQQKPSENITNSNKNAYNDKDETEDTESSAKFCPACGKNIKENWDYCMQCGEDINSYGLTESEKRNSASENKHKNEQDSPHKPNSELNRTEFKSQIQQLSPYDFEDLIGEIWSELGWETEVTKGAQDRGIDVVAQRDDETELIQVKRYAVDNKVGSNEVRKYATLYQQESDADSIALVTASTFTPQAEELASDLDVRAIDSDRLYNYIQNKNINMKTLGEISDDSNGQKPSSSTDDFVEVYKDFMKSNQKLAKDVMNPASNAADYDGAEATFARKGNKEQLRFAIEMRNKWADIVNRLEEIISEMEGIPDMIPQAEFAGLISEQIQSMKDLSKAYQRGLTYKDRLINSRLEDTPINPGELVKVEVPDAEILPEPEEDVEELKQSQDVAMTIATKETGKIGDLSDERRKIIDRIK